MATYFDGLGAWEALRHPKWKAKPAADVDFVCECFSKVLAASGTGRLGRGMRRRSDAGAAGRAWLRDDRY